MSSIAAMASRRAFARQSLLRAPPRRFYSASTKQLNHARALILTAVLLGPSRCHVRCFPDRWMVNNPRSYFFLPRLPHNGSKARSMRPIPPRFAIQTNINTNNEFLHLCTGTSAASPPLSTPRATSASARALCLGTLLRRTRRSTSTSTTLTVTPPSLSGTLPAP